jgi:hypothetical protein
VVTFAFPPARPGGAPVLNFRSEGRHFANSRCCLIPASAFFEFTGRKYPKAKRALFCAHDRRPYSAPPGNKLLNHELGLSVKDMTMANRKRSKRMMKQLGWEYQDNLRIRGEQGAGYKRRINEPVPDEPPTSNPALFGEIDA